MTTLRILTIIAWGLLLLYMAPGAWSAARGKATRHGDPMRLGVALVCLLMIGFVGRWLIAPNVQSIHLTLYGLAILTAGYIAWLARGYGRGPKL